MLKFIYTLRHLGIEEGMSIVEQKRIMLINEISTIFGIAPIFMQFSFLISGQYDIAFFTLGLQLMVLLPVIFNSLKRQKLAIWTLSVFFPVLLTLAIILSGREIRADYTFAFFFVLSMYLFDNNRERIVSVVWVFMCYGASEWGLEAFEPTFEAMASDINKHINFANTSIVILLIIGRFVSINRHFEKQNLDLVASLQEKNQSLMDSQFKIQEQNTQLEQVNKTILKVNGELAYANDNYSKANRDLEAMKVELERSNDDLRQFASMASHDLKAPLRNINSFIGLTKRKAKKYGDESINEYLDFVSNSAVHMSQLIEDILEYARIGNEKLPFAEVKLDNLVVKAQYNLNQFLKERNARVEAQPMPNIIGNATQLSILFQNLIQNGIKYNVSEIRLIEISYKDSGDFHQIAFTDNGIGIKEEYQEQIFEMFKRLHAASEYKGSGIGLATCHRIVERHQGKISVQSQFGEGSTFIVELPKMLTIRE